jgi:hypothetical protein
MNPILQGVRNLLLVELAAAVVFIEVRHPAHHRERDLLRH